MAVYTSVTFKQLSHWLKNYSLGDLIEFKGIASGIENTNYFVTTQSGKYVLTLFERLQAEQLPFYLNLMAHLAARGIPCPAPLPDLKNHFLGTLNNKPAAVVKFLSGQSINSRPKVEHCAQVGKLLADIHLAGQTYSGRLDNPRGPRWWRETAPIVTPFLDIKNQQLLQQELSFQLTHRFPHLPRGVTHADLFKDNVLFSDDKLSGVIDFYFAGIDALLFDIAVTVNDWCVNELGALNNAHTLALLKAYHARRPLTIQEGEAWPVLLRAAALRFWLSRLYDFYLPRPGELTHAHNPDHFRNILKLRAELGNEAPWIS